MTAPCEKCPVFVICLNRFDESIICDIVWKYIIIDTEYEYMGLTPIPGPTRSKRVKELYALFGKMEFEPEDRSDKL